MTCVNVLQITDTLSAAGRQLAAVNLANLVQSSRYRSYLCTTRRDGPLERQVRPDVGRLRLARKYRIDFGALGRLVTFIKENQIDVLHAHGESLFIAGLASLFSPHPVVLWHDHHGNHGQMERPKWLYRLGVSRVSGVIAVTQPLAEWSKTKLQVPEERVWYVPNLVCSSEDEGPSVDLPGVAGARIVCVARLQPQKDHLTLLRAMALVIQHVPNAHLLIVGKRGDPDYFQAIQSEIAQRRLNKYVSLLGERHDVPGILKACSVGVLSSASEAFPLALLEYGYVGLPVVATRVGQVSEILAEGSVGMLVPPGSPEKLAESITMILQSPEEAREIGKRFKCRIQEMYSPDSIVEKVCEIYETVLHTAKNRN